MEWRNQGLAGSAARRRLEWDEDETNRVREGFRSTVYCELRHLAQIYLNGKTGEQRAQLSAVVDEVFLRVFSSVGRGQCVAFEMRAAHQLAKSTCVECSEIPARDGDVLGLSDALQSLKVREPIGAHIVELCYLYGFSEQRTGAALGISTAVVARELRFCRAWLIATLRGRLSHAENKNL